MDHYIYASAIGTLVAEISTLPICTVKTIYQNSPDFTTKSTIQHIYDKNGLRGFFLASTPAIIGQVISTSTKYSIYEIIKNYRKTEKSNLLDNSINGLFSGLFGSILTHPIDCWKNFNQRNENYIKYLGITLKEKSFIEFIKNGLYKGYSGSIGKNIALYGSLFPLNDFYKSQFNSTLISAPLTTITVSLIVQPFDYYKVVVMAGNKPNKPFRGLGLMMARSLPHFAITIYITELLLNKL
jgi:hypothetical protein